LDILPIPLLFIAGFLGTLLSIPPLIRLAGAWGLVDRPAHRKIHLHPVPYLGGVAVFIGLIAEAVTYFVFYRPGFLEIPENQKTLSILAAGTAAMLLGLADDLFHIRARWKLAGQAAIGLAFALFVCRLEILHLPGVKFIPLGILAVPVSLFWILAITNAYNLLDGVDGLAGSVALAFFASAGLAASAAGDPLALMMSFGTCGVMAAFLLFNWKPASIYLGDSGSNGLGMLIACGCLCLGRGGPLEYSPLHAALDSQPIFYQAPVLMLLNAWPALEVSLSVLRRSLRGRSIGAADRGHIHHRLKKLGWAAPQVCLLAAAYTLFGGFIVLALLNQMKGLAALLLAALGLVTGWGLQALGFLDALKPASLRQSRPHFAIVNHFVAMQKAKLGLARDLPEVFTLVEQACVELGVQQYRVVLACPRGENDDFHQVWKKPRPGQQDHEVHIAWPVGAGRGFKDKCSLARHQGGMSWIFEARAEEDDLDIEYRVQMNEFMAAALDRARDLCLFPDRWPGQYQLGGQDGLKVVAHRLKRRVGQA
jgi:UDP-GlcNAc:undecaprenyl-phosphate/decaprenyl-phosphate GlcNAc-1-phosphate transferase